MHKFFKDKFKWLEFAQEHNGSANPNAVLLNGSQSYTLVAIHLASRVQLPKSVLLDVKRAQGKFVETHFKGLRQIYETNIPLNRWTPVILQNCKKFALEHSLDFQEFMENILEITEEEGVRQRSSNRVPLFTLSALQSAVIDDEDDIKI